MTRDIFLHVGFAKCGSTSLQNFWKGCEHICYPKSGINGSEHLVLPLKLKGIDRWTRQFFSEDWVDAEYPKFVSEIDNCSGSIVISSERLASLSKLEILSLKEEFSAYNLQIVFVTRDRDRYLNSTWRHAVYWHDYAYDYQKFLETKKEFSFDGPIRIFKEFFPDVHTFNMDSPDYPSEISKLIGVEIALPRDNVGISQDLAEFLQGAHQKMGSRAFKEIFNKKRKNALKATFPQSKTEIHLDEIDSNLY